MESAELPIWAVAPGVPSPHIARAALHAAYVIDRRGSQINDVRESYWHRATGGFFPEVDLRRGERLLIDCGLVEERNGQLVPTPELDEMLDGTVDGALEFLAARALTAAEPEWLGTSIAGQVPDELTALVPDPGRREELLIALGRRFDDRHRRLLGEAGEEIVAFEARTELERLGYVELARAVRRVSLESDQLGYDISAPRISGTLRLLEVKATTGGGGESHIVHLTRNEADVGARYPDDWSLVICRITDLSARKGEILGWCSRVPLEELVPQDAPRGSWEQARVEIPQNALTPGLPRAVD